MNQIFSARLRRSLCSLAAGLLLCSLPLRTSAQVTLNLKDADIGTLIATVSEVTGKNFIVDARVKGKVTVISSTPMDASGVYETFLAVLQVQGFAAIPAGEAIKIVPETNARQDGGTLSSSGVGLPMDEVVTHVYAVQNVSAVQLVPILRPLVPQWGHLAAYASSNMLIISDRAANVARLEKLIRQIDQSGDRDIEVVKLQHASAAEVVRTLTSLTQAAKQGDAAAMPATVIADERSNSVLIGGDRAERQKMLDIVAKLDIELGEDGATQVVYLAFASAENLAPILEGYAQQIGQSEKPGGGTAAAAAPSGGGNSAGIHVVADKDTNALIITAPPKAMRQVRDVIAQLDIRRSQVLVEGIIAEVSQSKSSQLGIDWAVFNNEKIAAAGILNPATLSGLTESFGTSTTSSSSSGSNIRNFTGLVNQGINIAAGRVDLGNGTSFALLLKALKGDGDSNVLSTPNVTTMDNEEAEFSVGQEVPFLTGSFSNTGSTSNSVNPFQTIDRKDVGLTLKITPQINQGNSVKLKIGLEVSSLASGATGAVDLVTNKRTLTNTVTVDNGQILVLSGLLDDSLNDTQRGVPFVSSIPLLGALFKYRSVDRTKRNLMVFIRPAILRSQLEGDYYTRRKYDSIRAQQSGASVGAVPLIGGTRPLIEDYDRYQSQVMPTPEPPAKAAPGGAAQPPESPPDTAPRPAPSPGRPH